MLIFCWYIMVGCGNSFSGSENRYPAFIQAIKRLWTGDFMNIMPVNVKYIGSIFNRPHYMTVPDFIEKCLLFHLIIYLFFLLPPFRGTAAKRHGVLFYF